MLANASAKQLRIITYVAVFFLTFTSSLSSYVNSSYLATLVGDKNVGLIYIISSLATIVITLLLPKILCRLGIKLSTVIISALSISGLMLVIWQSPILLMAVFGFIGYNTLTQVARYNTDLYLETISDNSDTGGIRGVFMTMINLAWLVSPLLASYILGPSDRFYLLYFISAVLMIPFMIIIGKILPERTVCDPASTWRDLIKRLIKLHKTADQSLRKILMTDFLLNFFYAVMVIYLPLLLHEEIGFSWTEVGLIFTIMLIPFVIIEYPLGKIADKWLGERELLATGFIIAGVATIIVSTLQIKEMWLWAGLLFLTRVGAATIEIMKETALFKRIDGHDAPILSISRNLSPLAYIIAPLFAMCFYLSGHYQTIFLALGIVMLLGLYPSLTLKDSQ